MDKILKIVFSKKSSSKSIAEALRLCKKLKGAIDGDAINVELTVQEIFIYWEWVNALLNIIDKWRSFEIFYKDRLCVVNKDYRRLFYALQEIRQCYFHEQDNPEDYEKCNQGWGCHKVHFVALGLLMPGVKLWYQYGHLIEPNIWIIDKPKILSDVQMEIERKFLKVCPAFPNSRIQQAIDELPESLTLDEKWEVVYTPQMVKGVPTEVVDSIRYIPEINFYTKAMLSQINKEFGDPYENECPYKEGTDEWSNWMIDKNLRDKNQ